MGWQDEKGFGEEQRSHRQMHFRDSSSYLQQNHRRHAFKGPFILLTAELYHVLIDQFILWTLSGRIVKGKVDVFFMTKKQFNKRKGWGFFVVFGVFYVGFLSRKFRIHRRAGEGEASSLTPPFNFHLLHRHLAGPLLQRAYLCSQLAAGPRLGNWFRKLVFQQKLLTTTLCAFIYEVAVKDARDLRMEVENQTIKTIN